MALFESYIAYVKDNPKGYWFKRKLYGWGWTPVKWQGWLVIALFVLGIFLSLESEVPRTAVKIVLLVVALLIVCRAKGEKPGWQWGTRKEE